jgi:Acetyltransferase (GNAT) domain
MGVHQMVRPTAFDGLVTDFKWGSGIEFATSRSDSPMVYEIDPLRDPRWPEFLNRHPSASVFHTRGWLETLNRTYGYRPAVLTTSGPNSELTNGVVLCRVHSWLTGRRLVSLPFSDHCEPLAANPEHLACLVAALEALAMAEGCKYVELRPTSQLAAIQSDWRASHDFCLHRLDLRPGASALFHQFHRDCIQRRIRHAEKEGVHVRQGRDPDMLREFYGLVLQTRRRHGVPPQPLAWFSNLMDCLGEAVTIRCAYKGDLPVAAILTLQHRNTLYYKYGASLARFHSLGAIPCLFWHAIQDAIGRGLEGLDMGRSACDNVGLVVFKERWSATRSALSYLRSPADDPRPGNSNLWGRRLAGVACRYMPERCLTALGALCYRHID